QTYPNERTRMNKIEKILGFGAIFLMILRLIIDYPYSALLITLSIFILSLIYLFFSFKLLNSNKKDSTEKTSSLRQTGIILTGITLSLVLIGILFKFLQWPYGSFNLMVGLLCLIPIIVISIFKFTKSNSEFYKNLLFRILIIGVIGTLLLFTKNETLLELKYRDFPNYVEAEKKLMQDPTNKELEIIANKEREKMHQSK
ncbi:GldL-related protein, partial [Olleya sp. 1-3]|uniref:GldL-related protein n=1 Tax=Olleya sp. 1-3 TaxID=2058323 RepID=UPI000CCAB44A